MDIEQHVIPLDARIALRYRSSTCCLRRKCLSVRLGAEAMMHDDSGKFKVFYGYQIRFKSRMNATQATTCDYTFTNKPSHNSSMAGLAVDNIPETTTSAQVSAVEDLARSVATVTVHDNASQPSILQQHENDTAALCPIRIYTRRQLLLLHNSSLVQLPPNMPVLKDWFGYDTIKVSSLSNS